MKLTDALLGEHATFYALFDEIEAMASVAGGLPQIQSATTVLNAVVVAHARIEEELLFPALEERLGPEGPLAVMRHEHTEIDRLLEEIENAEDPADAANRIQQALAFARAHFKKEEVVLFQLTRQVLDDETLTRLGQEWADARQVTLG